MNMFLMKTIRVLALLSASWGVMNAAHAQVVRIEDAWARATVPGQASSGAFMKLTAAHGARLEAVNSPAAGAAEIHEMVLQDNVMRMRPLAGLELPPGRTVELKPGGLHVMLLELKAPLVAGSTLPLELQVRDAAGALSRVMVQVPVRALGAPASSGMKHGH